MADLSRGYTFGATETVTNTKLHSLVDDGSVSNIAQADIVASSGLVITSASNPSDTDALWIDSSGTRVLKFHDGSDWSRVSPATTIETLDVVSTETTVIQSSTSEETLWSYSVPANTIGSDGVLTGRIWSVGLFNGGASTATIRFKYGSTTLATLVKSYGGSATERNFDVEFEIKGDGSTSSQEGFARARDIAVGTSTNANTVSNYGTASEDSTGALTLSITAQSNVSSANISLIRKTAILIKTEAV
jgi:hypothetical protein